MVLRADVEMFAHFRRQNFGNDTAVFPAGEEISPVGISFLCDGHWFQIVDVIELPLAPSP